jgi:hypothetical protein
VSSDLCQSQIILWKASEGNVADLNAIFVEVGGICSFWHWAEMNSN